MDEARLDLVRDWLTRASHDLGAARALSAMEQPLLDTAIYHCQQAAEKTVKGWLQLQDEPFPRTHDIEELVNHAAKVDVGFRTFAHAAGVLTPYVSAFRYPGGSNDPMPSREEFDEALRHAEAIYDFVIGLVPSEAKSG